MADTLRVLGTVLAPTMSIGVIKPRPAATMRVAERLRFDRVAIATMRALRARHGHRPLLLRLDGNAESTAGCSTCNRSNQR